MKKSTQFLLPLLLCCSCITTTFSQNKKIDSLFVVLKNQKEDTSKVNTYDRIVLNVGIYDLDQAKDYNIKLFELSKKINYKKGIGLYYYNSSKLLANDSKMKEAILIAKKAKSILYGTNDWDSYFLLCAHLSAVLAMDKQYEESKFLLETCLKRALKNNRPINIALIYNQLSGLYLDQLRFKEALYYAKKNIVYQTTSLSKSLGFENIAMIYESLQNYKLSLEYIDKGISLANNVSTKNSLLITKANILLENEKFDEGLNIILPVSKYYEEINGSRNRDISYYLVAKFYYYLNKYDKASIYINKRIANQKDPGTLTIQAYVLCSKIYLKKNLKNVALQYINKAISLFDPVDNVEIKQELYNTKSEVEEALGNYKNALSYYKMQATLKEQSFIQNNQNKISELLVNFNVTDKDNSIKKLQIAKLQKTIENKKQRESLLYVSAALLLALLSTFFYKRNNGVVKNKNRIIELTNVKLENEKLLTQKSLVEKETLLKEIHHRVKNNMQLVMSLLNIQAKEATTNINDFVSISQSRILSMSLIHENLYQTENLSQVDFKEYVKNLTESILSAYGHINDTVTLQLEIDNVYFDIQHAMPLGLIINELINNAYKHAFTKHQKGTVILKLTQTNDKYELVVSDNGVGIQNKENAKKTLGLQLVDDLVFQLGALLKIENQNGMTYQIQF
jgi:two-component system, sensor histidine kinase PdtaS